jgi:hypothetical protein
MPIWSWPPHDPNRPFWDPEWQAVRDSYPFTESNKIVRIPVAGPTPFNTLVAVRGFFPDQGIYYLRNWVDGRMHRQAFSVRTAFTLIGFAPGQVPAFHHSTAAALRHYYLKPDTSFTVALDKIDGRFDDAGRWVLDVETAFLVDWSNEAGHFHFSSFVLCNEPWGGFGSDPKEQPVWPDQ